MAVEGGPPCRSGGRRAYARSPACLRCSPLRARACERRRGGRRHHRCRNRSSSRSSSRRVPPEKGGGGAPRARARRSGDPPRVMQVCSAGAFAPGLCTPWPRPGNEKAHFSTATWYSTYKFAKRSSVSFRFNLNLFERCVPRNLSCQSTAAHFTVHVMIRYFRHSWRARLGAAEARHGGGAVGRGDTSRAQEGVRAASSARGRPGGGSRRARRQPSVQLLQQTHSRARRACHRLNRHRRPRSAWRRYSSS